jgi:hypothetical protein
MRFRNVLFSVAAFFSAMCFSPASSEQIRLMDACSPPTGIVFSFGTSNDIFGNPLQTHDDGVVAAQDGFDGMSPSFLFDGQRLLVRWGDLKVPGVDTAEPGWSEAVVVQVTSDRVTAVEPSGSAGLWMHTLFWRTGVVYSSRHFDFSMGIDPTGYTSHGAIYYTRCAVR